MSHDLILTPPQLHPTVVVAGGIVAYIEVLEQHMVSLPPITDQASLDAVRATMNRAGEIARDVDAQRANAKKPYTDIGKQIDAVAKPIVSRLSNIVDEAKRQIAAFAAEQDRIRTIAANTARIAQAAAAEALRQNQMPQLQVTLQPETFTLPTRTDRELRIVDRAQIPAQYWTLDERKVKEHLMQGIAVPGAELVTVTSVVNR